MRRMKKEIPDDMLDEDQIGSQLNGEGNDRSASGVPLKKGPWTTAEDDILVEYVKKNGEGNWNVVQKQTGLLRCGKSCRLRWANHLRPHLKKGAFTEEEERVICELHAKMGNRWARMAVHLPGRTDNEIKNYWNTRIKRRHRAGLPLYPPGIHQATLNNQSTDRINGDNKVHSDFLHKRSFSMHDAMFDFLKDTQGILPYSPDISGYGNMQNGFDSSQYCSFVPSTSSNPKRFRESPIPFLDFGCIDRNGIYPYEHIQDDAFDKLTQPIGVQSPLDPGFFSNSLLCYSHSLKNGNFSTSKPFEAVKPELPSLQYPEIDLGSWGTSPPHPLLDSIDDFIKSPTPISTLESDCSSPQNSGLLQSVLHQRKTPSSSKNQYYDRSSNSSSATPRERDDSSAWSFYEPEWEDYADPVSPSGVSSILNECPAVGANINSLDEQPPVQTDNGNIVKSDVDRAWSPDSAYIKSLLNNSRPDFVLDSDWYAPRTGHDNNQSIATDATSMFQVDQLATNSKHMTAAGTSNPSQVWELSSFGWNNMPAVCQVSDLG